MFIINDARVRLAKLGIVDASIEHRGSGTFFVSIDLGETNHHIAYAKSTPIYECLEAAGLTMRSGGYVGDHGSGSQSLDLIITLNAEYAYRGI